MKMQFAAGIVAGSMTIGAVAQAQETITAVHAFPETLIYTQSFLSFVDKVNEAGAGVVQIEVRGGPEAIGMFQQPDAVRDGIVDMVYTPGSFYGGALPEKDALVASNGFTACSQQVVLQAGDCSFHALLLGKALERGKTGNEEHAGDGNDAHKLQNGEGPAGFSVATTGV